MKDLISESKYFIMFLSLFWSFAATAYIGAVTFMEIPQNNIRFADTILGFLLGTVVATVLNFWLGSSVGSKEKEKNPPPPPDQPL